MTGSKTVWLALAGLVFYTQAHALQPSNTSIMDKPEAAESKRRTSGDFELDLGGVSEQEGKDSSEGAYLYFSPNFNIRLSEEFRLKISPWARVYSTRSQERFSDSNSDSFVFLYDAYGSYEPVKWFEARAGILSQNYVWNSMLVSNYASFPGAQAIFKAQWTRDVGSKFIISQTIPVSHSNNDERQSSEGLPRFTTLSGDVEGKAWDNRIAFKAMAGYYEWSQMPSKVVEKSRVRGNWGVGETIAGSKFLFEHKGVFGAGEVCYCDSSNVGFVGEYKRIYNPEVPGQYADAEMFGFGPRVRWKDHEFNFRYRSFFIEREVTVAAYNRSRFGHTNRIGENLSASLSFEKHGFNLFVEMFKAKPLIADPTQNQKYLELYYFGVETHNVSFF